MDQRRERYLLQIVTHRAADGIYLVSELFHMLVDQSSVMLGRRIGKCGKLKSEAAV